MTSADQNGQHDATPPENPGPPPERPYRWVILALLWMAYAAFGMVSRSLPPLVTPLLRDLGLTFSQMGLVMGSWQLVYVGLGAAAGSVTDRFGVRKAIFLGILILSLSVSLRYFVTGFYSLLAAVMCFGIGAPLISIGSPSAILHWFSGKGRGVAVGIYTTGLSTGALIALSATNSVIMPLTGFSWRLTFVCYGAVTLAMALIWLAGARDAGQVAAAQKPSLAAVLPRFIRVARLRMVFFGGMLAFATSHGLSSWLPKLFESQGMKPAEAGVLASVPMLVGIFAVLLVPALTAQRFRGRMVSCLALVNCLSFILVFAAGGSGRLMGLVLFGIAGFSIFPLLTLLLMETPEVGGDIIGMASGVFFAVAEIGGFSSPLMIGALYDLTGSFLAGIVFLVLVNLLILILGIRLKTTAPAISG